MNTKKYLLGAFFLFCFILSSRMVSAQGVSSDGKDFYLGFIAPSYNSVVPVPSRGYLKTYAVVTSFQDNTVYVSYFEPGHGAEETPVAYKVLKHQSIRIPLDNAKMRMPDPGDINSEYRACHIVSNSHISVQFLSTGPSAGGSYLALPTNGLGKKYAIANWNDNPDGEGGNTGGFGPTTVEKSCGAFEIIGTFNGTNVRITPTNTTQGSQHPGVNSGPGADGDPHPYSITLNRGECYLVKSWCETNFQDISGSTVTSDKPVVVISAHENAFNGNIGGGRTVEMRDYMVESMIPVESWDTTGYVCVPMVDSNPLGPDDGSPGETYRLFAYDTGSVEISAKILGNTTPRKWTTQQFASPVASAKDITVPINFYSTNKKKFMVMAYDQRNQATSGPYATPSMMSIVPMSHWKKSYIWATPNDSNVLIPTNYIAVIGPGDSFPKRFDSIMISKDGSAEVSISGLQAIQKVAQYLTIPGQPYLKCFVYKIPIGSYYAHANFPFMVYTFGQEAYDATKTLGSFDGNDYYLSYANPAGMILGEIIKAGPNMSVTIDTFCSSWHLCVTDHRLQGGIRSVLLLYDPDRDIAIPPDSILKDGKMIKNPTTAYVSTNTSFDPKVDTVGNREIIYAGTDSVVCFDVLVDDASKNGYAAVYIIDNAGNTMIVELRFTKAQVKFTPRDSQSFGVVQVGNSKDTTIQFINLAANTRSYTVTKAKLTSASNNFTVTSVIPTIPALVKPGDTLRMTLHFNASDTSAHYDSILIQTDCFSQTIPVSGEGGTPLIVAGDIDFKNVLVGFTKCDTTSVRNVGKLPFTLTQNYLLQDTKNFSLDPATIAKLPAVINPGQFFSAKFCYAPTTEGSFNTNTIWNTDIREPYTHSIDDTTKLKGSALPTAVYDIIPSINVRLAPNPVNGNEITVFIDADATEMMTAEIYDVLGRKMSGQSLIFAKGESKLTFDVHSLPSGAYLMRVNTSGSVRTVPFEIKK